MSSEAVNPELFIFKIFVGHQSYRIWSLVCCQCKWSPGNKILVPRWSHGEHATLIYLSSESPTSPSGVGQSAACSGWLFISNINNETFELKKPTYTQNVLLYSINIIQMFATLLGNRMDAFKVIYTGTLLKGGNEMAPVLTYLGTRTTFHRFIYVHNDMCAALLLFYLSSICSASQRKEKEEGKVKSQPFFYLHWDTAVLVPRVCLEMRLIVGNSESSAGLDGRMEGSFRWQTTVN